MGHFYPSTSAAELEETNELLAATSLDTQETMEAGKEEKKHQSRGGKSIIKDESKKLEKEEQKRKVPFHTYHP